MTGWLTDALDALAAGEPAALLTVVGVEGSAPRPAGTRMVVTHAAARGSIGGGALEYRAVEQARRILAEPPGSWRVQDYPLGPLLGQCCGGRVKLQVERLHPGDRDWLEAAARLAGEGAAFAIRQCTAGGMLARSVSTGGAGEHFGSARLRLTMIGAGHVGTAIARVLADTPVALDWLDTRPDFAVGGAALINARDAATHVAALPPETAVLVLTHDHGLDYALVAAALGGAAGFVGLIGSAAKRARFVARLGRNGVDATRLVCPIGVPGIAGKEPAVIAVAVAAQLLALPGRAG